MTILWLTYRWGVNMKIKCTKEFKMEDGDTAYTEGKVYEFEIDDGSYLGKSDVGKNHYMENEDLMKLNPLLTVECFRCYSMNKSLGKHQQYRCKVRGSCPAFEIE